MSEASSAITSSGGPAATMRPPYSPAPGTEIDEEVRPAHRLLVVLDDEHRVAEITQPLEGADELLVVALVQADRGLVEHVEHADEGRADLRREPDALRLPAGEGRGRATHREVADADVVEEPQALLDLTEDQARDVALRLGDSTVSSQVRAFRTLSALNSWMPSRRR